MMATPARKQVYGTLFVALLLIAAASAVYAFFHPGPWIVPEAAKQVPNPLTPTPENLSAGKALYLDKCAECHGESGKGDGDQSRLYSTQPTNFTDPAETKVTDGELFYKISEGHRPMPGFKKRFSEERRWQLVLFLRSFAQQASPK